MSEKIKDEVTLFCLIIVTLAFIKVLPFLSPSHTLTRPHSWKPFKTNMVHEDYSLKSKGDTDESFVEHNYSWSTTGPHIKDQLFCCVSALVSQGGKNWLTFVWFPLLTVRCQYCYTCRRTRCTTHAPSCLSLAYLKCPSISCLSVCWETGVGLWHRSAK